jgi:hypothetical protein
MVTNRGGRCGRSYLICLRKKTAKISSLVLRNSTHGLPLFYVEYNSPRRCGISAVRNFPLFLGFEAIVLEIYACESSIQSQISIELKMKEKHAV